ncbi:hypothetical protein [Kitasatospora sp. NPDC050463]|uniref:hypothetical protein n=1 Tax=Kitasatospora sp. NPDC050463 TaxID=3155786 RepID=UPI0033D6E1BB
MTAPTGEAGDLTAARAALARRQEELLAALVAGGPVPPGFDPAQVRAQSAGLAAKRRDTTAKVAPELPRLLGRRYGPLFLAYAGTHPQTGGYRADARAFAAWALSTDPGRRPDSARPDSARPDNARPDSGQPGAGQLGAEQRRALEQWLHGPAPERPPGPLTRLRRALRPGPRH